MTGNRLSSCMWGQNGVSVINELDELVNNYEELANSLDAAVWEADAASGRLFFVSQHISKVTGYQAERFTTDEGFRLACVHPEDRANLVQALESASEENPHYEVKYRLVRADGKIVWLRDIVRVIYMQGRPKLLLGLTIDFNDRARSENAMALVMDVITVAGEAEEPNDIFAVALRKICQDTGWVAGQVWLVDELNENLTRASLFYGADEIKLALFGSDAEETKLRKGEGLAGKVWQSMSTEWVARSNELVKLTRPATAAHNLVQSAIAFPIKQDNQLMAVLEFYSNEPLEPDEYVLSALDKLSQHLSTILQRYAMKSQLYEQWQETQVLLDLIPAFVWYKDTHNRILRCNQAAAQAIGLEVKDVEGRLTEELFPHEAEGYYAADQEVIVTGRPKLAISEQMVTAKGRKLWIRTDKVPVKRSDGSVAGLIVFSLDVTEEKRQQSRMLETRRELQSKIEERTKSLRTTESKLSSLSRLVPGVLYQYVVTKDGAHSFPYVSDAVSSILELDAEDVQNDVNFFTSRLHLDDQPRMAAAVEAAVKNVSNFRFEGRIITGGNQLKWIQAAATPEVQPNGDILWNGIITDITDLKLAQEKIRQLNEDLEQRVAILGAVNKELELLTHKLEISYDQAMEASRLKSEFVANISHEVRTPISAVIGMSELLMDTPLTEEQRQFTRLVRESALSLLTIINDILDFSKMEAGKIDLELIEFGPVALVEGCAELLASSARERGLSLMTYVDRKVPRMLQGDPVRLRQVLLNLTSNAIKFTERGEVSVRVTCAESNTANLVLLFEVSDTGIGLPETARKLLFQPFTQADGSTSRRYGGTGLGLSICKRLVELMGGKIDVESSPGIGSRFWFTVPFDLPAFNPDDPDDTFRRDISALVFDDSEATASIVSLYLEASGIEAECASTVAEMLKMIEDSISTGVPYQLVLIGVTGDTKASEPSVDKIVSTVSGQPTRLILLTTLDDRERIESMLLRGFSACLSKPIRQSQLLETVNRVLSLPEEPHTDARYARAAQPLAPAIDGEEIATEKPLLVAEDNPVMQELAVRRIRKMGLEVKAVSNGREVIEAMVGQEYALILMDCQMPEMDGFEATAAIRRQEATTGRHTPIVAMTAAAMIGDRENCLTSGMDDYLSKPVSQEQLVRVLRKWLPRDSQFTAHITPFVEDIPPAYKQPLLVSEIPELPLDLIQLERLYGKDLSTGLLASFVQESADLAQLLEEYAKSRDAQGLAQQAHQLKGLASVMTAEKVATSCTDLERAVKEYDWEMADLALGKVQAELGAAVAYVTGLIAAGDDA